MKARSRERRACRSLAPYFYFSLQVLIVVEITYMFVTIFGTNIMGIVGVSALSLLFVGKCFARLMQVLGRCKMLKQREHYEMKAHFAH